MVALKPMKYSVVHGNLLHQDVDVIVNAWNRNIIPWWMLLPQGVSGGIKKSAGNQPFREVGRFGPIPLGGARLTSAGRLNFKAIIHVAGINMFWCATEYSLRQSVINAISLAEAQGYKSIAFPLIGSGSGNRSKRWSMGVLTNQLDEMISDLEVVLVDFRQS
jgi:O-acetyl-ADP-ribose deacetylase (regulator of RNase III)